MFLFVLSVNTLFAFSSQLYLCLPVDHPLPFTWPLHGNLNFAPLTLFNFFFRSIDTHCGTIDSVHYLIGPSNSLSFRLNGLCLFNQVWIYILAFRLFSFCTSFSVSRHRFTVLSLVCLYTCCRTEMANWLSSHQAPRERVWVDLISSPLLD